MLRRILATLRVAGRPMCPADLGRVLDIDEAALVGMLDTLVARGRLRRIDAPDVPDDGCGGCPVRGGCFIMTGGAAPTYALTDAGRTVSAGAHSRLIRRSSAEGCGTLGSPRPDPIHRTRGER